MKAKKMVIGERIKELASDNQLIMRDFSDAIGFSYRTVQNYISGKSMPNGEFLVAVNEKFGASSTWLLTGNGEKYMRDARRDASTADSSFISIARLDVEASAGHGSNVDTEETTGHYAFNKKWLERRGLKTDNLNVIAVTGDSMEPNIYNGDLILIDRAQNIAADGRIFATRYDGSLFVKRIQRMPDEKLQLISTNPVYPPVTVSPRDGDQIDIVGRVVASMHEW